MKKLLLLLSILFVHVAYASDTGDIIVDMNTNRVATLFIENIAEIDEKYLQELGVTGLSVQEEEFQRQYTGTGYILTDSRVDSLVYIFMDLPDGMGTGTVLHMSLTGSSFSREQLENIIGSPLMETGLIETRTSHVALVTDRIRISAVLDKNNNVIMLHVSNVSNYM